MLPSIHTSTASKLSNWGYISFFGCIAALVTLLFFAIGQVKQADEARKHSQVAAEPEAASDEQDQDIDYKLPGQRVWVRVEPPYSYKNEEFGFSFNYVPLVKSEPVFRQNFLTNDSKGSVFVSQDGLNQGTGPIVRVLWMLDSRTNDQYKADEVAALLETVNGIEGVRVPGSEGDCPGGGFSFPWGAYRITINGVCESGASFSEALNTLKLGM